ncbi:unnamed protein product [Clonostachys rhizophaga]|uniref:Uncharacterized protein n=1 Tax=Clonostachys rhizophaga TaxID=160324 RepID=A0A9N9UWE5_9HYPO|nr:unnamed protein product [Clonostachys rhizophaga]
MDLHRLPRETLLQIVGYLADSHRPSLYAFALASKSCYISATVFIFRHIHLALRNPGELQHDVDALLEALSRTDSYRHVSALSLKGCLDVKKPISTHPGFDSIDPLGWWKSTLVEEPRINTLLPNTEPIHRGEFIHDDERYNDRSSKDYTAWAPIISLIKTLPSLAKLVYDCPDQFPPSLLDALHSHHPRCRLHHLKLRLQTPSWDHPDPHEMALATSPCLHGARLYCAWRDSEGVEDFSQEAMMELVAGLAPNLKEVAVTKFRPPGADRYTHQRGKWKGLAGFPSGSGNLGSLASLSLLGTVYLLSPTLLQTWSGFTDFSCLRYLALGGEGAGWSRDHVNGVNGEVMAWMAHDCSFTQLKVLRLVLERDTDDTQRANYGDNAVLFFTSLGPLEELSVTGPLEPKILKAIIHQHGPTLEKLGLHSLEDASGDDPAQVSRHEIPMIFTKEHIQEIHTQCPILEELAIPVKRTQSNAAEVSIYKSLARLDRLKSLFLILDCSDWRVSRDSTYGPDPSFDEDDRESWSFNVKRGDIRVGLINSAVDETLARAIWGTICQHKVGRRLESLRLWTTGGGVFGNDRQEAPSLFTSLSRSWSITRLPRDDMEVISVEELGRFGREASEKEHLEKERRWKRVQMSAPNNTTGPATIEENQGGAKKPSAQLTDSELDAVELDTEAMRLFRRIWPRTENGKGWCEEWTSFPLQI